MKFYQKHLLFIPFLISLLNADDFGVIEGIVTDSLSSNPLSYANIFLSNTGMGSTSREDG